MLRSLLFVPADSPRKLEKSLGCGADALIVDLEDSVAADRKAVARAAAAEFLSATRPQVSRPVLIVRVNALDSGLVDDDLAAVIAAQPEAILLPKAAGGAAVVHADAKITAQEAVAGVPDGQTKLVALATETAASLFVTGTIAGASPRLIGLTWGAEDLSADIGAETNRDAEGRYTDVYRIARALCLASAASAAVPAYDTVSVDFRDVAALRREAEAGRRDGFVGMLAIHPAQVEIINTVYTPSAEALALAKAVVDAFAAAPDVGVVAIEGKMYDSPHLRRAQRLLARFAD